MKLKQSLRDLKWQCLSSKKDEDPLQPPRHIGIVTEGVHDLVDLPSVPYALISDFLLTEQFLWYKEALISTLKM